MRKVLTLAIAAAAALFAAKADASVLSVPAYNINFGNYGSPVTLDLAAGTYSISYGYTGAAGQFQAWDFAASNFGSPSQTPAVSGCDANGANCGSGWFDSFGYNINGAAGAAGSVYFYGPTGTYNTGSGQAFATPALALAAYQAALTNETFTLASTSNVTFFIPDAGYNIDNSGGVTLALNQVTAVPEPSSIALLGIGLLGLGYIARRKFI